jgi:hypothetical protein
MTCGAFSMRVYPNFYTSCGTITDYINIFYYYYILPTSRIID